MKGGQAGFEPATYGIQLRRNPDLTLRNEIYCPEKKAIPVFYCAAITPNSQEREFRDSNPDQSINRGSNRYLSLLD
jgi:hypothetical protein